MLKSKKQTVSFNEIVRQRPEYICNPKEKIDNRWLCQCKHGHMFDYRKRILYPPENKRYAPCQGKCPICGCSHFTFVDEKLYPIQWNFLGD